MVVAYVGLGANLGDAMASLQEAAAELAQRKDVTRFAMSPLYRTAPVDSSGPDYVNGVAALETTLSAHGLLQALQQIEQRHGRLRPYRNAPRTLDLDLLLYGAENINEPDLIVPHPRMHERAFVLRPLADLAPDLRLAQGSLPDLLAACSGQVLRRMAG